MKIDELILLLKDYETIYGKETDVLVGSQTTLSNFNLIHLNLSNCLVISPTKELIYD